MSIKTQGTQIFFVDPAIDSVVAVECAISLDGISAPRDQLESTCLDSPARTYEAGLATPGQFTVGINFDPGSPSHLRLMELWESGEKFEMAVGYSDGTAVPTGVDTAGMFELPTTRSWLIFHDTYVADFPQTFALNTLVTSTISLQLSGFPELIAKA